VLQEIIQKGLKNDISGSAESSPEQRIMKKRQSASKDTAARSTQDRPSTHFLVYQSPGFF
jgi:hypothetical protein